MVSSIELQVISKLLTTENRDEIDALTEFDTSYYSVFKPHIEFIYEHFEKYNDVPDTFTFQAQFPDINLVKVTEPLEFLKTELRKNKQHILMVETFNKLKDLGSGDVDAAWQYLNNQCDKVAKLEEATVLDLVKDAKERAKQVAEFSKQKRIPTGFAEIDKVMYGGLSTVEELVLIIARSNTGKSWVCTKMMESAQKNGFPVLYYSPEMQGAFLGTRFDSWRGHFLNSQLFQGKYDANYIDYLDELEEEDTSAFILEDKDSIDGTVNARFLSNLVKKHGIKLLIVDGLSYLEDTHRSDTDYVKYKNICLDLFKLSKQLGCAVVVAVQANRETHNQNDDKGEPLPTLRNIEGSDHPGRICTQAFSLRQIFDKHVLDIRLEKSRNANNQKPIFSYAWDVNTGNMQYLPNGENDNNNAGPVVPTVDINNIVSSDSSFSENDNNALPDIDLSDDDIEF